ncbi:hypothetical protein [Halomicrococcus sp. NG-SE-24]|uniref:hypothetical protein n=1 Tax=Halomicrococcus sp. NG-SE-24 TaxID=3436928 RepID=UPI003D970524
MSYRDAVMAAKYAGGASEQATALHQERLDPVVSGTSYFGFDRPRGVVVHLVPDGVYDDGYAVDLSERGVLPEADPTRPTQLPVLGNAGDARGTWTADGFGAYVEDAAECRGYAHLFSNGVVESVSALPFEDGGSDGGEAEDGTVCLDGRALELDLTACVRRYLRLLAYHQTRGPVHVAISVFGAAGCRLDTGEGDSDRGGSAGDGSATVRTDLLAPFTVTLDGFDCDVRAELADPVDALWRGAGFPGSPFFDGEWTLRSAFEERR